MTDRKIVLTDCRGCPSLDHKGGFGSVAYIPVCRAVNKEQPYTVSAMGGGRVQASKVPGIPDWCPLPFNFVVAAESPDMAVRPADNTAR